MKMYLISDNTDTLVGMQLAGVKGELAHTREETINAIKKFIGYDDCGIILVTSKLKLLCNDYISEFILKLKSPIPLFLEIPDRHSAERPINSMNRFIEESIGLKL